MENPSSPLDTLRQLKEMLDAGALTPTEFEALKQRLVFSAPSPAAPGPPAAAQPAAPAPPTPVPTPVPFAAFPPPAAEQHSSMFEDGAADETPTSAPPVAARPTEFVSAPFVPPGSPVAPVTPVSEPVLESESRQNWAAANSFPELTEEPLARNPLALILSIGGMLVFLAVVAYLSVNRPPSEHISSTSQTEADSLALAAPIETGPQAEQLPQPVAVPETVRVAPTNPAPVIQPRPMPARDSAATAPATVKKDSAASQ